jgi:hypothetical protein
MRAEDAPIRKVTKDPGLHLREEIAFSALKIKSIRILYPTVVLPKREVLVSLADQIMEDSAAIVEALIKVCPRCKETIRIWHL